MSGITPRGITIRRVGLRTRGGFRDDGVSVGTFTVTANTTGEYRSGVLSVAVAAGSLCNFYWDTAGSSSGSHISVFSPLYERVKG